MMRACAPVREQIHPGPGAFRAPAGRAPSCGWTRPCAPDAPAAHLRSPLAGEARAQGQELDPGRHHQYAPAPRGDDRAVPGHWEADPIIGGDSSSALITLVERTSRFVLISRLGTCHDSATVTDALKSMVDSLPRAVYSTITWDQGAEMADHAAFTLATDIKVYFADPHSPRSASHQREHRRPDPRVLPQGHRLQQRHRHPGPGRPGPAQPPPTRSLERTDPHRDTGHHHQRCNHHLTPPWARASPASGERGMRRVRPVRRALSTRNWARRLPAPWTHRSSLLVWCSFGQVVMGGRAGRPPAPSVLLWVWSMSVRCRREVWER